MKLAFLSWREFRSHAGRTLLSLLSIVVGVASVVSVAMATRATREAYADLYETLAGRAGLQIVASLGGGVDQQLVLPAQKLAGVESVVPVVQRATILRFKGQRAQALAIGIDPNNEVTKSDYPVAEGTWLKPEPGVLLETAFAKQLGVQVGDSIKLLVKRGLVELPVVGLVAPAQGAAFSQGLLFLSISRAQYLFRIPKQLDVIYLNLADGADEVAVQKAMAAELPEGVRVEVPPARSALADQSLMAMYQGLNLASSLSVVVASFIIMNTFLMTVAERTKQMAIMRAIGATRKQILWLIMREGLWFGISGTVLGLAAGVGAAALLTRLIGRLFGTSMPAPSFTPTTCVLGVLVGLGVSLLASLVPAWKAARIPPLQGMRQVASVSNRKSKPIIPLLGFLLLCAASAVVVAVIQHHLPFSYSIPGTLAIFIALVLMLPLIIEPAARVVGFLLLPILGFEGKLAQRQLLRHRARSILTLGVLFVATATGIGTSITVLNDSKDVDRWFERSIGGDFFVRAMMLDMRTGKTADLPASVGEEIQAIPGIEKVRMARFVSTKSKDDYVIVAARDFNPEDPLYLDLKQGDEKTLLDKLLQGSVVIGNVLSERMKLNVGDTIELESENGTHQLPIVGVANDYAAAGLVVYMERKLAEKMLGITGVDVYIVQAKDGRLPEVEKSLDEITKKYDLLLQSYADVKQLVYGTKNGIIGSLWGLLALGFIVATFGIANTLAMNVLEQTREIGLLRVIAMTRGQVRRMIVSQAIILGVSGLTPGLIAGIIMALVSNYTTHSAFGHAAEFHLHPALLLVVLIAASFVVVLAAVIPAIRAAGLEPAKALRHE